jgi:Acyl-CoA carboxylase epsilon subunit
MPGEPRFKVVSGHLDDRELAALTVVLLGLCSSRAAAAITAPPARPAWLATARYRPPGAWTSQETAEQGSW